MKSKPDIDFASDCRAVVQKFAGAALLTHMALKREGVDRQVIEDTKEGDEIGLACTVGADKDSKGAGRKSFSSRMVLNPLMVMASSLVLMFVWSLVGPARQFLWLRCA